MTALIPNHALVTGGGTGVGAAVARALAEAGVNVTICGRRREPLDLVAASGERIYAHIADVTDEGAIDELYLTAQAERGPFDLIVANAGAAHGSPTASLSLADWTAALTINLTGAFLAVRPALSAMRERGRGRIVFIASTAGLKGYPYVAAYVAAKHGVIGLMRALAVENATNGITVNAICPGFTETEMLDASIERIVAKTGRSESEARAELARNNPQRRFIQPEEIAAAVLWLASDAAASVNGQSISISGGETW